MRIAIIADIHGNLPALEAVSAPTSKGAGIDRTINLGACVSGPLWPREVCDLLMASSSLVIRGNHDRWVSGPDPASMGPSDRYARLHLDADPRQGLGALPTSVDARVWYPCLSRHSHERQSVSCQGGLGPSACSGTTVRLSNNDWEMFTPVLSSVLTVTSNT